MKCIGCGGETRVLETRLAESGAAVVRRRRCEGCGARATTIEVGQGEAHGTVGMAPRARAAPGRAKGASPVAGPSPSNVQGFKARAVARRRLEEIRDLHEAEEASEVMSVDELRREMGW